MSRGGPGPVHREVGVQARHSQVFSTDIKLISCEPNESQTAAVEMPPMMIQLETERKQPIKMIPIGRRSQANISTTCAR